MPNVDRRTFLKLGGASLAGIAMTPWLGGCNGDPVGPGNSRDGFVPFITPTEQFYVQYGGRDTVPGWSMPDLSPASWSLAIQGRGVKTPMTIRWSDMQAAIDAGKSRRILKTMRCILDSHVRPGATGWTGNAYWTGIPLRHFLDTAGLYEDTKRLIFNGYDDFTNNITIQRFGASDQGAMEPLLVYEMNGAPLSREHGGPVRLLLLEGYGYKSVKWLKEVNASLFDTPTGDYQREGFDDAGIIGVASRSINFNENIRVKTGQVEITGYALSGYDAIARVDISVDDGDFKAAELISIGDAIKDLNLPADIVQLKDTAARQYRGVWTQWRFLWSAAKGAHTIAIRATDAAGNAQPDEDYVLKDGLTGIVRYNVTVE